MDDAFKKKLLDYFDLLNQKYDILKISLLKLENKVDKLENKEDGNHHFLISQLENYRQEVNQNHEEIIEFKDGVYNKMDAVYGEVVDFRDEQKTLSHRSSELEDRVEAIEKVPVIAHSIRK